MTLQLADQLAVGIILAIVLSQTTRLRSYAGRLALVTLIGFIPFLMVSFPYWNWYAFPRQFTVVEFIDRLLTIFCGGLVLAAMIKPAMVATDTVGAATPTASAHAVTA